MGDHHSLPLLLFLLPSLLFHLFSLSSITYPFPLSSSPPPPSMPCIFTLILLSSPSVSSLQFLHPLPCLSPLSPLLPHVFPLLLPQMTLKDIGRVRLFKLGVATDEYAVVFTNEYIGHARQHLGRTALCKKFVDVVLPACQDVSITRKQLTDKLRLSEEDIS